LIDGRPHASTNALSTSQGISARITAAPDSSVVTRSVPIPARDSASTGLGGIGAGLQMRLNAASATRPPTMSMSSAPT